MSPATFRILRQYIRKVGKKNLRYKILYLYYEDVIYTSNFFCMQYSCKLVSFNP